MALKKSFALTLLAAALAGCGGGGDVVIAPSTNTTINGGGNGGDTGGGGGGTTSTCGSYTDGAGTTFEGTFDGTNCTYSVGFVDIDNPLEFDATIPNIGSGVHIFEGSLVVGRAYNLDADLAAAGIAQGGDGAVLTIAAGNTLAFRSSDDYMVVNRGSQVIANGTSTGPITFTSQTDAVFHTVGPEDVSQWGGIVINGFGVTNKCAYTGSVGDPAFAKSGECHVTAEGKAGAGESYYGGDNNADSSGVLRYVIVKHTGAEVAPDNELNGIAFGAVGSGTVVENLEAYSTYDDGIEMFGGAVNITNYVALYVRDDSIDIDEGYRGNITNALVIQSRLDGNSCMESDGIGSYSSLTPTVIADFIARGLNSQPTLTNVTCIISANQTGTHDPGIGLRIREGHIPHISNFLVTTAYSGDDLLGDDDFNYCFRVEHEGGQAALDGDLVVESSVFACQDLVDGDLNGSSTLTWLRTTSGNAAYQSAEAGEDPTAATNPNLVILDGFYSVPVASMVAAGQTIPAPVGSSIIGAVGASNDWTAGWTYGLHDGSRAQALWFE